MNRRRAVAAVCVLIGACRPHARLPSYGVVPDFTLTDQTGGSFSSARNLDGKVWIANFIFTNCGGPCPRMSGQMKQIREELGPQGVRFVSFTIDPARDTPAVLAAYAKRFQADPRNWHFLTGPRERLHHLTRNVFLLGDVDGSLEHSTRFVLVDAKSRIRGFYDSADQESIRKLASDARALERG